MSDASRLRDALEGAGGRHTDVVPPQFSADGGVTVFDRWGRSARVQPLGGRVRVSLAADEQLVAEGEVDASALVSCLAARDDPYDACADALEHENGPGHRASG